MFRRITPKITTVPKQYKSSLFIARNFTSAKVIYNADDKANGGHSHSHNGVQCSGHSHDHSHNHGHSHSHSVASGRNTVKIDKPMLMLAFTCKKCDTRSSHVMSKQAYQHGTILVKCPGCQSRHLVADHLKIFSDNRIKLEDIMKAQGESIKTDTSDLIFEDIPESLKKLIGHHAKDAPEEYKAKQETSNKSPKLVGTADNEKK